MRRLKQVCYSYQQHTDIDATTVALVEQFKQNLDKNMTETSSALSLLGDMGCDVALNQALEQFFEYWKADTHAINYWFRIQASMHVPEVVSKVRQLIDHPAFDIFNPNKINALLGSFINNPYGFHNASGEGYTLVAKMILVLDKLNPPLAANLTLKFASFDQYDEQRKQLMRDHLMIIKQQASSVDVINAVKKGLG
jgi:aminopeptidase N